MKPNDLIRQGSIGELVRNRVRARLSALGRLSITHLCNAWAGELVNGQPPLKRHHIYVLLESPSPKLREMAQLAEMMGVDPHLLIAPDTALDIQGRSPTDQLYDLDAYPIPPPVASIPRKVA